jgi:hypothetical protein
MYYSIYKYICKHINACEFINNQNVKCIYSCKVKEVNCEWLQNSIKFPTQICNNIHILDKYKYFPIKDVSDPM